MTSPSRPGIRFFGGDLSAEKAFARGTHRVRSPAETFALYRRFMAQAGITRIANVTGLDYVGIPVFVAIRPNSCSLATAQGKGLDRDAARTSALMEGLEIWHAEQIDHAVRWAAYHHLCASDNVVDLERLGRLRPLKLEEPRAWVRGFDLIQQQDIWVPLLSVTMSFVGTDDADLLVASGGLASGNHLLEAMVHGLAEVIERDAEILWRLKPGLSLIDLDDLDEDYCRVLVGAIRRAGVVVAAWDITSDLGVAACGALVMNHPEHNGWRALGVHYGFGCHPDPAVALSRALSEAVQTRLTYISGSRDDLMRANYEQANNPDLLANIHAELTANPPSTRLRDLPNLATTHFEGDLQGMLDRVRAAGLDQVVVVDLSKPGIGIPVVRVLVPGLEFQGALPGSRARRVATEEENDE